MHFQVLLYYSLLRKEVIQMKWLVTPVNSKKKPHGCAIYVRHVDIKCMQLFNSAQKKETAACNCFFFTYPLFFSSIFHTHIIRKFLMKFLCFHSGNLYFLTIFHCNYIIFYLNNVVKLNDHTSMYSIAISLIFSLTVIVFIFRCFSSFS